MAVELDNESARKLRYLQGVARGYAGMSKRDAGVHPRTTKERLLMERLVGHGLAEQSAVNGNKVYKASPSGLVWPEDLPPDPPPAVEGESKRMVPRR